MITGKSEQTPRPFRQQRVSAEQNDQDEQGRQEASSDGRSCGVIEDLNQRDAGHRFRGSSDVADTEAYRDEEDQTSHSPDILKIPKDEARWLLMVIAGQNSGYHNYECDNIPNQYTARNLIEEVRSKDVKNCANASNQVRDENSMPALYLVAWKRKVSLTQDEIGTDEVVGRSHCKNPSFTYMVTLRRESSPVIMNHPVIQLIPLAILGGANMATQEYCPPFVGKALQISANEYATASVKTQMPIQEYIITGGPPDCTPMIRTLPSAVQLVTILKLKPIIPRRPKDPWDDLILSLSLVKPALTDPSVVGNLLLIASSSEKASRNLENLDERKVSLLELRSRSVE
ncbi:MAG: hypothetical protein Q9188_003026 [Gyalolechia gomerana]